MITMVNAYKMLYKGTTIEDICDTLDIKIKPDDLLSSIAFDLDDSSVYNIAAINQENKDIILDSPFSDEYNSILANVENYDELSLICDTISSLMDYYPDEIDIAHALYKRGYEIKDALANVLEERYCDTGKDVVYPIFDLHAFRSLFEMSPDNIFVVNGRYFSDHNCEEGIGQQSLENWFNIKEDIDR